MNGPLLIPTHISKYGCYSSYCIFAAGLIVSIYERYIIALLAIFQSIVSYFNWKTVKKNGWVKTIDILIACIMIIYITVVDSASFRPRYRQLWYTTVYIIIAVFIVNELLLYYQVKAPVYESNSSSQTSEYFSLNYTAPGSAQREYAYYRSTFTHIMFIHLIPSIVVVYCIYQSA